MNKRKSCFNLFGIFVIFAALNHAQAEIDCPPSLLKAERLFHEGCFPEALDCYENALKSLSNDPQMVLSVKKKWIHALFYAEEYAKLVEAIDVPVEKDDYFLKGIGYSQLKNPQKALECLQAALALTEGVEEQVPIKSEIAKILANVDLNQEFFAYWRLLNLHFQATKHFEEGKALIQGGKLNEASLSIEHALKLWEQLSTQKEHSILAQDGLKARIYLYLYQQNPASVKLANDLLHAEILSGTEQVELDYLYGLSNYFLSKTDASFLDPAKASWKKILVSKDLEWSPLAAFALGQMEWEDQHYAEAEHYFSELADQFSDSSLAVEALFFASRAAEKQQKPLTIVQEYRRKVFEKYPESPYAAEAYLTFYPSIEYLQGGQSQLRHLQAMPQKFPKSPLTIYAYFLLGLDHKKEHRAPEGKLLHKERYHTAIEFFQNAETLYDLLEEKKEIPSNQHSYFYSLRLRSILERAAVNSTIAEKSVDAKRRIYLEYATEVFKKLIQEIENTDTLSLFPEPYPSLLEESHFGLAQTYIKLKSYPEATHLLDDMLKHYHTANITRGYLLSRVWYEKAKMVAEQNNHQQALEYYQLAEEAAKGKLLSADQQIDLWIQQSQSWRQLKDLDQAMLILSKAINEDVVSALRLKAMYLRAEIYLDENRPELAQRQLEALAKKGGEWGQKAKEKLGLL